MKRDMIILMSLGIAVAALLAYMLATELSKDCRAVAAGECALLQVAAILSIIGGALFAFF